MVEIKKHSYEENPELLNFINEMRNADEIEKKDDLKPIICICKNCHATTEINKDDEYKTKFFRCCECGYVMGPVTHHIPKMYWYIVSDETNRIEPEKWFGDEADAKEYVAFCGLSEKQIHKKYAIP